jgi:hypothetical protein
MKTIDWVDEKGRKRRSLVKNSDGIEAAPLGIPVEPPDIRKLDWEAVIREIEEAQYNHGMYSWTQAQQEPGAIQECINIFKRHFIRFYKLSEQEEKKSN